MPTNQPKTLKSESKGFDMKKHYVTRREYDCSIFTRAACEQYATTESRIYKDSVAATYRKNHVTCKNCRRTKIFRGIKVQ